MQKTAHIILGLGYGDEGKGLVTDSLCQRYPNSIVVRFNGGQQAGHTVYITSSKKHVFSNLGVGTHRGIPTYWSKYCSFSPGFFLEELSSLTYSVKFYLDEDSPVTTHYDILFNCIMQKNGTISRHGSCGLGVGPTFERHHDLKTKFTAKDLLNKSLAIRKLREIRQHYKTRIQEETNFLFSAFDHDKEDKTFIKLLADLNKLIDKGLIAVVKEAQIFNKRTPWSNYLFEGAQGILLDQTFGVPPYVTKSNTTSRNAMEMIERNFSGPDITIILNYVTRAYLTRHGDGPFVLPKQKLKLAGTFHEANRYNEAQGVFKVGYLDFDLLNYSIRCDDKFSKGLRKEIFFTCLDQLNPERIPIYLDKKKTLVSFELLQTFLDIDVDEVHYSFSRFAADLVVPSTDNQ
jgi:adenylosuccinate synthase